jgi:predicted GIY-YIG superfamily endonuclease
MTDHSSISDDETWLYRLYRKDGTLLYVGITKDWNKRVKQHRQQQPWWHEVDAVFKQLFLNRASAKAAESAAIRTENPLHNKAERNQETGGCRRVDWRCGRILDGDQYFCHHSAHVLFLLKSEWNELSAHMQSEEDLALATKSIVEWEKNADHYKSPFIDWFKFWYRPRALHWRTLCGDCFEDLYEDDVSTFYEIDLTREMQTEAEVLKWTSHLSRKTWLHRTNWNTLLDKVAIGRECRAF